MTSCNEYGRLSRVLLRPAGVAFAGDRIEQQWRPLNFAAPPELGRATEQYAAFETLIRSAGAQVEVLTDENELTLDAIYVRDASLVTPRGVVLCRMGKPQRAQEPAAHQRAFETLGIHIAGRIEPPGQLEGGDVVWHAFFALPIARAWIHKLVRLVRMSRRLTRRRAQRGAASACGPRC